MISILSKFLKLYTPFICCTFSALHGVLFICKIESIFYKLSGEFFGQSIIILLFIWIHSKRMCKWYKLSIISLILVHIINLMYYIIDWFPVIISIYGGLILNIIGMLCWLVFITTMNMRKTIRSACKHSETK